MAKTKRELEAEIEHLKAEVLRLSPDSTTTAPVRTLTEFWGWPYSMQTNTSAGPGILWGASYQ